MNHLFLVDNFLKEHLASLPPHFRTHRRKRRRHTSRARHRKTPQLPIQSPTSVDVEVPNRVSRNTIHCICIDRLYIQEELPTPSLPASPLSIQHQGHPSTTSLQSFPINGTTPTETDVFTLGGQYALCVCVCVCVCLLSLLYVHYSRGSSAFFWKAR